MPSHTSSAFRTLASVSCLSLVFSFACSSDEKKSTASGSGGDKPGELPKASCDAAGGSERVSEPKVAIEFTDSWQEAWLGSPAVVDLDGDGKNEVVAPRGETLKIWNADGTLLRKHEDFPGRVWASAVVADLRPDIDGLEYAVASREEIHAFSAAGEPLSGFPFAWRDELRAMAAGDIDGDGSLELVAVTTSDLDENDQTDILIAVHADGSVVSGFPPNTTGAAGPMLATFTRASTKRSPSATSMTTESPTSSRRKTTRT